MNQPVRSKRHPKKHGAREPSQKLGVKQRRRYVKNFTEKPLVPGSHELPVRKALKKGQTVADIRTPPEAGLGGRQHSKTNTMHRTSGEYKTVWKAGEGHPLKNPMK